MSSLASKSDVLWYSREKDAAWLAAQLRSSRLTILQGQLGSGKSTLLRYGLMSRLTQRMTDPPPAVVATDPDISRADRAPAAGAANADRVVIPFPDRRRHARAGGVAHDPEVVVYVDAWDGRPLATLWAALHKSLGISVTALPESPSVLLDALVAWQAQRGVRFLFVLDDFDACLKSSTTEEGSREFVDQWVQAVHHPRSPAHFVVAMSEPAEPLWQLLARHQRGLGELADHQLQLVGVSPEAFARQSETVANRVPLRAPAQEAVRGAEPGREPSYRKRPPPQQPVPQAPSQPQPPHRPPTDPLEALGRYRVEDVTADGTAAEANEAIRKAMRLAMGAGSAASPEFEADEASAQRSAPRRPSARLRRRSQSRWTMALALCGVVLVIGAVAYEAWDRLTSDAVKAPSAPTSPNGVRNGGRPGASTSSMLPAPGFELVADAGDSSDDALLSDLAQLLTPNGFAAPTIRFPFGWAAEVASLAEQPRITTVTFDVLQAARQMPGPPSLQIVTPLFAEEIYFLVRSDSRLRFINQIRSAKMNIGPERGSRALTANGVFQRLFGVAIPQRQIVTSSREEALDQLLTSKAIDVLVLVGAQPDPWLHRLSPDKRRGLRMLELEPRASSSRRATAAYLPVVVRPEHGSGLEPTAGITTLSTMTFLITGDTSRTPAADQQIRAAATALCTNLPALQQGGHDKWRDVRPGSTFDTGWPTSSAAREGFANCRR